MSKDNPVRFCFILGIQRRSGTNFLYRLLQAHPDCDGIGPIGEDYLVQHTDLLRRYVENVKGSWNPEWQPYTMHEGRDTFFQYIGDSILHLLEYQSSRHRCNGDDGAPREKQDAHVVVTKTPSVGGVSNFFTFFPEASLILLVRDGRSVVESGMRSFGWRFEKACREWACAARQILAVREIATDSAKIKLVRYEDLVQDSRLLLNDLFAFMGVDSDRYDFSKIANLEVIGSSDLTQKGGAVHWESSPKEDGFAPLKRFEHWTPAMHRRFNWIAGREMERLGYAVTPVPPPGCIASLLYRLRDVGWYIQSLVPLGWDFVLKLPAKIKCLFN